MEDRKRAVLLRKVTATKDENANEKQPVEQNGSVEHREAEIVAPKAVMQENNDEQSRLDRLQALEERLSRLEGNGVGAGSTAK